jgi:hypothetical protein
MDRYCRVLSQVDYGSLIYQGNRLPFITGCELPFYPNTLRSEIRYQILPTIVQTHKTLGLLLDFYITRPNLYCHPSVFIAYEEHLGFLEHIAEAQAIYLLESTAIDSKTCDLDTFFRLLQHGQGFEITDQVRKTIEALHSIAPVLKQPIPLLSAPSLS